jgi:hypothetical protein
LITNTISLVYPRQKTIRRFANDLEDVLQGDYSQPQTFGIPDDFDPEAPRMVFPSNHGFSSIVVSQIAMSLTVNYSEDWQLDYTKGRDYLREKTGKLFDMYRALQKSGTETIPQFFGMASVARVRALVSDDRIIGSICASLGINIPKQNAHEIQHKWTTVEENMFFSNVLIQNYRQWNMELTTSGLVGLRAADAAERGIQVTGDYNDRFAYQELNNSYSPTKATALNIIEHGLQKVLNALKPFSRTSPS